MRHSHIAFNRSLSGLAQVVGAKVANGEDELGVFRYFDLNIAHGDGSGQSVRLASHAGDKMVHLLAERIGDAGDLAAALFAVGLREDSDLSISTDRNGRPARSAEEIRRHLADMVDATPQRTTRTPPTTSRPAVPVAVEIFGELTGHVQVQMQAANTSLRR